MTEREAEEKVRRLASALGLAARVDVDRYPGYSAVLLEDGEGGFARAGAGFAGLDGVWRRAWADLAGLSRPDFAGRPMKAVPCVVFKKGSPAAAVLKSGLPPEAMEIQAAARGLGFS